MAPSPLEVAVRAAVAGDLRPLKSMFNPAPSPSLSFFFLSLCVLLCSILPLFCSALARTVEDYGLSASEGHQWPNHAPLRGEGGGAGLLQVLGRGVGVQRQLHLRAR